MHRATRPGCQRPQIPRDVLPGGARDGERAAVGNGPAAARPRHARRDRHEELRDGGLGPTIGHGQLVREQVAALHGVRRRHHHEPQRPRLDRRHRARACRRRRAREHRTGAPHAWVAGAEIHDLRPHATLADLTGGEIAQRPRDRVVRDRAAVGGPGRKPRRQRDHELHAALRTRSTIAVAHRVLDGLAGGDRIGILRQADHQRPGRLHRGARPRTRRAARVIAHTGRSGEERARVEDAEARAGHERHVHRATRPRGKRPEIPRHILPGETQVGERAPVGNGSAATRPGHPRRHGDEQLHRGGHGTAIRDRHLVGEQVVALHGIRRRHHHEPQRRRLDRRHHARARRSRRARHDRAGAPHAWVAGAEVHHLRPHATLADLAGGQVAQRPGDRVAHQEAAVDRARRQPGGQRDGELRLDVR